LNTEDEPDRSGRHEARRKENHRKAVVSSHRFPADPGQLRELLSAMELRLNGTGESTSRRAALIAGAVAGGWARRMPDASLDCLSMEIARFTDSVRLTIRAEGAEPQEIVWRQIGQTGVSLADNWGFDRRGPAGVWFELAL
jgi:hypothetical protein